MRDMHGLLLLYASLFFSRVTLCGQHDLCLDATLQSASQAVITGRAFATVRNSAPLAAKEITGKPVQACGVQLGWERDPEEANVYLVGTHKYLSKDDLTLLEHRRAQYQSSSRVITGKLPKQGGAASDAKITLRACSLSDPVQDRKKDEGTPANQNEAVPSAKSIDYLSNPPKDLPDFESVSDQTQVGEILAAVGGNVSRLFANLFNISAVERVQQQKLTHEGEANSGQKFEYLYLCLGAVDKGNPSFDEYRSDSKGSEISQLGLNRGYMLTSGFVSAPLIFHPAHQNGSSFRLLGHQKLKSRNTFVLAFAQIPSKSRIFGSFQNGKDVETTFKQGMVWIDAENFQIVRLVSNLLTPLPQIKLDGVETQIDFDKVQFGRKAHEFWLPVQVIVTVHWNGKVFRNTHVYSDFRLFNVETQQKITRPFDTTQPAEETDGNEPHERSVVTPAPKFSAPAK